MTTASDEDVLELAIRIATPVERFLARCRWKVWQVPPRVRARGGPARLAAHFGSVPVAYEVLAARWVLAGAVLLTLGAPPAALAGQPGAIVGWILVAGGLGCETAAWQRRLVVRRNLPPRQIDA